MAAVGARRRQASGEGAPAAPVTVACELLLPCSAFLVARDMGADEYHSLLANAVRANEKVGKRARVREMERGRKRKRVRETCWIPSR